MESLYRVRTREEFSWLMEYLRGKDVIPFPNNYFDRFGEDTIVIVTKDLVIKLSYTKEFFFESVLYEQELIEVSDLIDEEFLESLDVEDGPMLLKIVMTPGELEKQLKQKKKYRDAIKCANKPFRVDFTKMVNVAYKEFNYTLCKDGNDIFFVDLNLGKGITKMVST